MQMQLNGSTTYVSVFPLNMELFKFTVHRWSTVVGSCSKPYFSGSVSLRLFLVILDQSNLPRQTSSRPRTAHSRKLLLSSTATAQQSKSLALLLPMQG